MSLESGERIAITESLAIRLFRITRKYVDQAKRRLSEDKPAEETGERSLLERLIGVDEETATVMMMDMLIAGVDTVSPEGWGY